MPISSRSTCDRDATSPVFLAKSFTNASAYSSQSIVSMAKGKVYTYSLVLRSLSSCRTSEVVINLVVAPKLRMLVIEINALASSTVIDLRYCIVELL